MMNNRSIFEAVPDSAEDHPSSPFTAVIEPTSSPFTAAFEPHPTQPPPQPAPSAPSKPKPSPFTLVDEADEKPIEPYRPSKIPEKRKAESPFQIVEPTEGFGAMPALQGIPASPFEAGYGMPATPFSPMSEFGGFASAAPIQAYAPQPFAAPQSFAQPAYPQTSFSQSAYMQPGYTQPAYPQAAYPTTTGTAAPPTHSSSFASDCSSIRQLELRAIFGVAHEMGVDEILQRCRSLPGVLNIACLAGHEADTIESLKALLNKLGCGGSALRIYAGSIPVEFIREGNVLLAVQTDGGFAPGVRETLMIVAREMARLA